MGGVSGLTAGWLDLSQLTAHGFCLTWQPGLIWLHAGADAIIVCAYYSIPLTLTWFARARRELRYSWILWLFVAFILACGTTHAMSIWTLWVPSYLTDGLLKLVTAALSLTTAVVLWPLVPRLLALPSPSVVAALNEQLSHQVAEQQRTADLLRENETRLRLAQEAGRIGCWDWDLDASEGHWSQMQHELYGSKPSLHRVTPAAWLIRIHPNDRDMAMRALTAAWETGGDYWAEFRVLAAHGEVRWLSERGRVEGEDGTRRIVGVTVDVTERKGLTERLTVANQLLEVRAAEHQHALEIANEQRRALFDNSPDAMFILRVEEPVGTRPARFVYECCNPGMDAMMAGVLGEIGRIEGRTPHECFSPEVASDVEDLYARCVETGERLSFRRLRPSRDGTREIETSLVPVRDRVTGRVVRIVGAGRDVTERREIEEQLRALQKVEVTGRLTAGVAHDFNNLLQALMGGLELLDSEVAELPAAREYAAVALQAARRGADLTHRLLAFSRQQTLQPQPVRLVSLLASMRSLVERTFDPRIEISVRGDGDPIAFVDPAQLEAALLNLALNAREAMPQGGRLEFAAGLSRSPADLGLSLLQRDGRYVVLTVIDTGRGMDPDTLRQACEPFFTTKGPQGSGLGLPMVLGFARQSGGDIRVHSAMDVGTRVEIWLPEAQSAPPVGEAPAQEAQGRGRVLLVDDVPDVLVTAGAFLRQSGYSVVQVGSGDAALALLRQERSFDAIVTDYAMPGLSGLDLVRLARARQPGLPAMIMTGLGHLDLDPDDKSITLLHKPFGRASLLRQVRSMIDHETPSPVGEAAV